MSALVAELADIDLGDVRLNRRARRVLQRLGEKPTLSIPSACGGWGETRAAYRLFDHAEVSAAKVLAPHRACTIERLRKHPRVLCLESSTTPARAISRAWGRSTTRPAGACICTRPWP